MKKGLQIDWVSKKANILYKNVLNQTESDITTGVSNINFSSRHILVLDFF